MRLEDRVRLPARYRLTGFIAGGGMAGVWEAEDTRLGRRVAVKVLADHLAEDPVNARRFQREARAAARVSSHPHVVTIYDVGEHEGRSFIVMERLNGGTVADALRRGPVPRQRALTWLRDAAAALDVAHEQGVIHRDVKPGNLLRDDDERVRVADFGIARLASDDTLTAAGQLIGTAAYLSPEQILGKPTTSASDRYALAIVAYELLAGRRPFQAEHPTAQARQHLEMDPEPASTVNPQLPPAVDAVLQRGMAKEPERRWPSASAFVAALDGAVAGDATAPTRPVPVAGARRPRRGWPVLVALAFVAGAVALIVGLNSGGGGGHRALSQAAAPKHKPHAKHHRTTSKPATASPPAATTTPTPTTPTTAASGVTTLNTRQIQAFNMIGNGQAAAGLALDRSVLEALAANGYSAARCREPGSDPSCLVYAHALYDVGHALRVLGQTSSAIAFLTQRMTINDQRQVVAAELKAAMHDVAKGRGNGGAKPGKQHDGNGGNGGNGQN